VIVKDEHQFVVAGEPRSKERPRLNRKTGGVYTPVATVKAEREVAAAYREVAAAYGHALPLAGDVTVDMVFYTHSKTRRDLDNMVKLVLDGLNGVAYEDDFQVWAITARRIQVETKEQARTRVIIRTDIYDHHEGQKNEDRETVS
jgi:Holliday junction resolvase RusA-like endonuclease